jgi:Outer membrane protein
MNKLITCVLCLCCAVMAQAQRFAYVDTEYIMGEIPEYVEAQKQITQLQSQYQTAVEQEMQKVDRMFRNYQTEKSRLGDAQRQQREQEIINAEQAAKELQKSYFGQEGTLSRRADALIAPIREKVQLAIDSLAQEGDYAIIFDISAMPGVVFTQERYDLSGTVLRKLQIIK